MADLKVYDPTQLIHSFFFQFELEFYKWNLN